MYADGFNLRIVQTPDGIDRVGLGQADERFMAPVPIADPDVPLDVAVQAATDGFYEAVGPWDGVAFRIEGEYVSQGADVSGVTLVIELLRPVATVSWAVLGGLVLKALTDALDRDRDD